ncbi:hypothetical protein [Caldicellulosiruptor kronotskyensis]|nr:hypothetical protein [Caldicellulosiruptor kronotskyensis]
MNDLGFYLSEVGGTVLGVCVLLVQLLAQRQNLLVLLLAQLLEVVYIGY